MRKIIIAVIILGFFVSTNFAWARFPDDLPGPKVMPDSKFYFLKIWYEKIVLFFTFDPIKKVEKYKVFAEKRAYEIGEMVKKGRGDLVDKLKQAYKTNLNKAKEKLEKALQKAIDQKKEELKQELERKIEEIKNKLFESMNL